MSLFPELEEGPKEAEPGAPPPKAGASGGGGAAPKAGGKATPAEPAGAYLALARKYRPAAFEQVVGQEAVTSTLKNALGSSRLHHAYLFSGIRGVGKTTVARLFARALNCVTGPTQTPCGKCDPCREIASGLSMDVIEIDAASNRGVDDVEPLREAARYAPSRDRFKVFILDEVHMLSNAAFNSLLKILEEPPPRIVWMLATTEYRKIPPTVVSRCQHFEFRRVSREEVVSYLQRIAAAEKAEISAAGLAMIAAAAGGSVRDAVSLLDQVIAYAGAKVEDDEVSKAIGLVDRRHLSSFLSRVASKDAAGLLDLVAELAEAGTDFHQFGSGLVSTVRNAALARFSQPGSRAYQSIGEEAVELAKLAAAFGDDGLLRLFNTILDLPGQLRVAPQPRFALEAAALRLVRLGDLAPIEEVIAALRQPGSLPAAPGAAGSTSSTPAGGGSGTRPPVRRAAESEAAPPMAAPPDPDPARAESGNGDGSLRDRFLAAVQSRKLSLRTFLEGARALTWKDGKIEIVFGANQSFFRRGLESEENIGLVKAAAADVHGKEMQIEVIVDAGPAPAEASTAAPAGGAGHRERLIQEALAVPGVKMVMDAFSGRIVDIQDKA